MIFISLLLTCTQCAANVGCSKSPRLSIKAIGVNPYSFRQLSTSPFVSQRCIWIGMLYFSAISLTFFIYSGGQVYGACGPSITLNRPSPAPSHFLKSSMFSCRAEEALGLTPASPLARFPRIPAFSAASPQAFINIYISQNDVVPPRIISANASILPQ